MCHCFFESDYIYTSIDYQHFLSTKNALKVAFPQGDKEIFLSWDKGTPGQENPSVPGHPRTKSPSRKGCSKTGKVPSKTGKDVLKQEVIGKK